ncbi:S41 family peptidase [Maribacter forsetii]|uniref:S41 family peptidase n=1 Tax=Maribacter forsetii TaxID=444515 RepID=UPI00055D0A19|nr:S41 family peptidase [Maribacter forsetii]
MLKFNNATINFLFFIISISILSAQSDDCSCKKDLEFLNEKIEKTPSYKVNETVYQTAFMKTKKSIANLNSGYECFLQLNKLMLSLNDRHCNLYGIDKGLDKESKENTAAIEIFKTSKLYTLYPRPKIDLDSLKTSLKKEPFNSVEGIYYRKDYMTLGVYKIPKSDSFRAIILESQNDVWEVGEVIYTLVPYGSNYLLGVGGSLTSKRMIAYTEKIKNGVFLTTQFQKDPLANNYSVSIHPDSTYLRDELSNETTYLKVGSFNSWNPTLTKADNFYQSLEGTLTKNNLVLDLRDNGGGGDRNSNGLYKIFKKYTKQNQLYVLVNHRTASNAEQFAFKLSGFDNCTILGNRTNGTASYELVGANYTLPCEDYLAVLTSKKHANYMELESTGIEPDVTLTLEESWLTQVQNYIQEK